MVPKNTIANLLQRGICFVAVLFNVSCILGNTCLQLLICFDTFCRFIGNSFCIIFNSSCIQIHAVGQVGCMVPKNTIANLMQRGICFVAVLFNVSCILGNTCCILGNAVCYIRTSNHQITFNREISIRRTRCHSYIAAAISTEGTVVVPDSGGMNFPFIVYRHSGFTCIMFICPDSQLITNTYITEIIILCLRGKSCSQNQCCCESCGAFVHFHKKASPLNGLHGEACSKGYPPCIIKYKFFSIDVPFIYLTSRV